MNYKETLTWILDKKNHRFEEKSYQENIDFVHSLGKKCTLLYKVTDTDVKKALTNLKETLDYSDPMGGAATADIEAEFEASLDVLKELIATGTEKEGVLNAIGDSLALLKARNDLLKASK